METRTEILTNEQAGIIQNNCAEYQCEIVEIGIVGRNQVRVAAKGEKENLDALFELAITPEQDNTENTKSDEK